MSNDEAVQVKTEIISPAEVTFDPVVCPRCKGNTITLRGSSRHTCEQDIVKGETVERRISEESYTILESIECLVCKTEFVIMTEEEWTLHLELMKYAGKGRPC